MKIADLAEQKAGISGNWNSAITVSPRPMAEEGGGYDKMANTPVGLLASVQPESFEICY